MNRTVKEMKALRCKCSYAVNIGRMGYTCTWEDNPAHLEPTSTGKTHGYKCEGCKYVFAITNSNPTSEEVKELMMVTRRAERDRKSTEAFVEEALKTLKR